MADGAIVVEFEGCVARQERERGRAVALRLEDWVDDRSQAMAILSTQAAAIVEMPFAGPLLEELDELFDFESLVITDANGDVLTESGSTDFDPADSDWFETVADGEPIVTSPVVRDGAIEWVVAHPVFGSGGGFEGAVVGLPRRRQADRAARPGARGRDQRGAARPRTGCSCTTPRWARSPTPRRCSRPVG